jgi:hypothetical protein
MQFLLYISVSIVYLYQFHCQVYTISVMKKQIPRHVTFTDPELALLYECPLSLSALYRPVTIQGSEPRHTFSAPVMDVLTRTNKVDPLNDTPLDPGWRVVDSELEKKMAAAMTCIPLTYGGE